MKHYLPLLFLYLNGCQPAFNDQPKLDVYENGDRLPLVDTYIYGKNNNKFSRFNKSLIERGQKRYEIYCSVCHGSLGDGQGPVTQRGFSQPPSFHSDSQRNKNVQDIYTTITNGKGLMSRLGDRIEPKDRWAIASYVQALQLSQHFSVSNLTQKEKKQLELKK